MRTHVKLLLAGLVVVAVAAQACGGAAGSAQPSAPAAAPAAPVAPAPSAPAAPQPSAPTGPSASPAPTAPAPHPALTDEQVLADVDELLAKGVLSGLDLSVTPLEGSGVPDLWIAVAPPDAGSYNNTFDWKFTVPEVKVTAPLVPPIR